MDMDEGANKWLANIVRENHWRVAPWIGIDDLYQDGMVWWWDTVRRYGYRPRSRAHMMSLFKRSFMNYITDLANHRRKYFDIETAISMSHANEEPDAEPLDASDEGVGAAEIILQADLANAPEPLRRLLTFASTDAGAKILREYPYRFSTNGSGARETTNERLGRLLGTSRTFDYKAALKAFFAGDPSPA